MLTLHAGLESETECCALPRPVARHRSLHKMWSCTVFLNSEQCIAILFYYRYSVQHQRFIYTDVEPKHDETAWKKSKIRYPWDLNVCYQYIFVQTGLRCMWLNTCIVVLSVLQYVRGNILTLFQENLGQTTRFFHSWRWRDKPYCRRRVTLLSSVLVAMFDSDLGPVPKHKFTGLFRHPSRANPGSPPNVAGRRYITQPSYPDNAVNLLHETGLSLRNLYNRSLFTSLRNPPQWRQCFPRRSIFCTRRDRCVSVAPHQSVYMTCVDFGVCVFLF